MKLDCLTAAVYRGDPKEVIECIRAGRNINVSDRGGRTPLMNATIDNYLEIVRILIREGADVNAQDKQGWSALHFAAQNESYEATKMLLENGAVVDLRNTWGNTPLSNAVFESRGYGDVIKLLLAYGADRNLENNYGVSPLKLANTITNYDVAQFFSE